MTLVEQALAVGLKYPVFPTNKKMPSWSNKALGVAKGFGGYKIATQDPARIAELFSHPNAIEIAVPMGEMSGMLCVDVDLYKNPELADWVEKNKDLLGKTLRHKTRSGGLHFFFKHPGGNIRFPATLREGVDLKAGGNGYVCFPPTKGYEALNKLRVQSFPMTLLEQALKDKGGSGSTTVSGTFNTSTDDELIESIQAATDLYPALRTLSYRLPTKQMDDGSYLGQDKQLETLQAIMDSSEASKPNHKRHEDWEDRRGKLKDLVESANEKHNRPAMDPRAAEILAETTSFIDTQRMIAASSRPIGPQRETSLEDIEKRVAAIEEVPPEYEVMSVQSLIAETLPPIEWLIPGMIPKGIVSLGGTSNVGKTRWLAALAVLGASGRTELMGLPEAPPFSVLWLANEERTDDIKRRIKSTVLQHGLTKSRDIIVRGKDTGMLRLVSLNESGNPEIDEDNVAALVAEARRVGAAIIYFDPYVTLSDAMDENSAASAAILTKAFILISSLTGATVIHAHHTPKSRTEPLDWYRGSSDAWRGSGAIYSALDCGYTLSHYMPKGKDNRKAWMNEYIEQKLSRWIVLDTGKIREGQPMDPIVYELVGQDMAEGEGDQIGVCRLADTGQANNSILDHAVDVIAADELAKDLLAVLGAGEFIPSKVHKMMKDHPRWTYTAQKLQNRELLMLLDLLKIPVLVKDHSVQLEYKEGVGDKKGSWKFLLKLVEQAEEK